MWFGVSLLLCGETAGRSERDLLWEESIVLVQADSCVEARLSAEGIGKGTEVEYDSASGERIRWTLRNVYRVYEIEEREVLRTGTEVFSRFLRQSEVQSLMTPFNEEED